MTKTLGKVVKKDRSNYLRQLDIFDPVKYGDIDVHIIGAGGIGSFTTVALAKLGLEQIHIWDGDKVETHNLPNQLFSPNCLGMNKANALSNVVMDLVGIQPIYFDRFWGPKESVELRGIVISAVDHMEKTKETKTAGRREIWKAVKDSPDVRLFVDGRLGGQALRVLTLRPLADSLKYEWFEKRMFPQEQAKELPCTARNIIDVGFAMAALITRSVRQYLVSGKVANNDIAMDMANLYLAKVIPNY